jgi:hypothetical protein
MANSSESRAISGLIPLLMFRAWLLDVGGQRVPAKETLRSIVNLRSRGAGPDCVWLWPTEFWGILG